MGAILKMETCLLIDRRNHREPEQEVIAEFAGLQGGSDDTMGTVDGASP